VQYCQLADKNARDISKGYLAFVAVVQNFHSIIPLFLAERLTMFQETLR
jgi:hypothetical protein